MLHSQAEPGQFPFKVRGAFTPDLAHRKARQARRRGFVVQRGGCLRHAQRHAGAQGFHGPEGGEMGLGGRGNKQPPSFLMGVERFCEIHGLLMSFCLMDNCYDTHGV